MSGAAVDWNFVAEFWVFFAIHPNSFI